MIKIIGIGQPLRGDDEAGLAAVHLWRAQYSHTANHPDVHMELAESPGLDLLDMIQDIDAVILVDAVYSGSPAGTVQLIREDEVESFTSGTGSAHGFGVAESLALARKLHPESMPVELVLVAIEIQQVAPGKGMSTAVQDALPEAARIIQDFVTNWLD